MSDRTITKGRYEFDEKKHRHTLDGKALTGVTTILGVLNKPMLISWSANMAVDHIEKFWQEKDNVDWKDWLQIEGVFNEARKAWAKKRDAAGEAGTDIHYQIEVLIKRAIDHNDGFILEKDSDAPQIKLFLSWAEGKQFTSSEVHVYSERMFVGGICDIIYVENGKTYLADIKTSSGIYYEAFWQMGGYHLCLEEMNEVGEIDGYTVVNLPKKGGINVETNYGLTQNREAFEHCLRIYRLQNETKKTI